MPPENLAILTLAAYGLLFIIVIVARAATCPTGWRMWVLYAITRAYGCCCFHWRSNRRCPFVNVRPALVLANHRSPLDPLLIAVGVDDIRPLGFMMAREYYSIPGLRFINRNQECIPVARDGKDLAATRAALRRLADGKVVGIFPEGGLNTGPGLLPANPGVAWLALKSRAPVYPVFIENAPTGKTMVEPFFNFSRVRVIYGDPIDLSAWYDVRPSDQVLEQVTHILMSRIAKLGGFTLPPLAPRESSPDPAE